MLIIEGPDNSGKTTLAKQIAAFYDTEYVASIGPRADYDWWITQLKLPPAQLISQVRDRFFFSELVYGPLLRGKLRVNQQQIEVVQSMIQATDPLIITCEFVPDQMQFDSREQLTTFGNQIEINENFHALNFSNYWHIHYDWRDPVSVVTTLAAIDQWWMSRDLAVSRRQVLSRGRGPLCPHYMIVGIDLADNNTHKIPFEQSKSAHLVHEFLRDVGVDPVMCYFTNGEKKGSGLSQDNLQYLLKEFEVCRPRMVIGLGKTPSIMLSILSIKHLSLPHPGYFLRKNDSQGFLKFAKDKYDVFKRELDATYKGAKGEVES